MTELERIVVLEKQVEVLNKLVGDLMVQNPNLPPELVARNLQRLCGCRGLYE